MKVPWQSEGQWWCWDESGRLAERKTPSTTDRTPVQVSVELGPPVFGSMLCLTAHILVRRGFLCSSSLAVNVDVSIHSVMTIHYNKLQLIILNL